MLCMQLPMKTQCVRLQLQEEISSAETSSSDDGSSEDEYESSDGGDLSSGPLIKTDLFVTGQWETKQYIALESCMHISAQRSVSPSHAGQHKVLTAICISMLLSQAQAVYASHVTHAITKSSF